MHTTKYVLVLLSLLISIKSLAGDTLSADAQALLKKYNALAQPLTTSTDKNKFLKDFKTDLDKIIYAKDKTPASDIYYLDEAVLLLMGEDGFKSSNCKSQTDDLSYMEKLERDFYPNSKEIPPPIVGIIEILTRLCAK